MANILDYIDWRGDMTFSAVPFNEADNLILSRLSYIDFDGLVPEYAPSSSNETITLSEIFLRQLYDDSWFDNMLDPINDPLLMEKLAGSRRFGDIKLFYYKNILDLDAEEQFCAVTAILDDRSAYISFRGTDNTVVGWKEDFNMSYMKNIPSQIDAVKYLEETADALPHISVLRIGGHSKGGNLAIYASLKCRSDIQSRIAEIYNNDGPGFSEGFAEYHASDVLITRIHTYVPQTSIVGMLLSHPEDYTVIESSQTRFLQHDIYSWNVLGPSFIHLDEISAESQLIDKTITEWLAGLSNEQRSLFIDTLFSLLQSSDIVTLDMLTDSPAPKTMFSLLRELRNIDDESRIHLAEVLRSLFKIMKRNLSGEISHRFPRIS
jgi:hypothetical protein